MTVVTHTLPADLIAGLRDQDEAAIQRGFQELFPVLLQEADAELHDTAAAGRVVERAFVHLMSSDMTGAAPVDVDRELERSIRQAISRELSRVAALRRFEHNEGVTHRDPHALAPVDADRVWQRIQKALHAEKVTSRPSQEEAIHVAAAHMAGAMAGRRKVSLPLIVFGIVALAAAGYALSRIDPRPSEQFILGELASPTARLITASRGQVGNLSLGDETVVKLAADSRLRVSKNFAEKMRAVSVDGAASFDVARGSSPLELRATGVAISADSGTVAVVAGAGRPTLVRVTSGSPRITVGDSSWTAPAGQTFIVAGGKVQAAGPVDIENGLAWLDGRFVVNGTITDAVQAMRRWYDADVGIGDASIATWPAQVSGSLESLSSAISSLEKSAKVKMIWQNQHMVLYRR